MRRNVVPHRQDEAKVSWYLVMCDGIHPRYRLFRVGNRVGSKMVCFRTSSIASCAESGILKQEVAVTLFGSIIRDVGASWYSHLDEVVIDRFVLSLYFMIKIISCIRVSWSRKFLRHCQSSVGGDRG